MTDTICSYWTTCDTYKVLLQTYIAVTSDLCHIDHSGNYLVVEIKNLDCFHKPLITSSNHWFGPQPSGIYLMSQRRKETILTSQRLKLFSETADFLVEHKLIVVDVKSSWAPCLDDPPPAASAPAPDWWVDEGRCLSHIWKNQEWTVCPRPLCQHMEIFCIVILVG